MAKLHLPGEGGVFSSERLPLGSQKRALGLPRPGRCLFLIHVAELPVALSHLILETGDEDDGKTGMFKESQLWEEKARNQAKTA